VAVTSAGGDAVVLSSTELQLGRGETIEDTGRVLSRYLHAIVLRTFEQERLELLAGAASVPVVNSLSDFEHPCQCLADLLTVIERRGSLAGRTLTYLGDGNNVAHSLLLGGTKMGMHVRVAAPPGFEPIPQIVHRAEEIAAENGGSVEITSEPIEAATGADVLYTDVWASMGQETEADEREGVPGAQPRAQVADALLDATVLTVSDGSGTSAEITLRALSALTRMGFLPRGGSIRVDTAGRWVRVVARYGTVYLERSGSGLTLR
jgi:ornithine carbamoyltransferase